MLTAIVSIVLVMLSFFFVASEYALISARRGRLSAQAKKSKSAQLVLDALNDIGRLVAANQIAITMVGIGVGSITEPFLTAWLSGLMGASVPRALSFALSYLLITYVMVVVGELMPKFLALNSAERLAIWTIRPLLAISYVLSPLVWLARTSATLFLRPFGIRAGEQEDAFQRDELLMLIKSGQAGGALESTHAELITRALKLDALSAKDIMIHRLDVLWLDINVPPDQLLERMAEIPHSRVPVCNGDIDDVVGIAYIHDLLKNHLKGHAEIQSVLRKPIIVPENLTLDRLVSLMREERTQILIVVDEYGGTSGLITLEDVVEEVFGELEDSLESERPPVETHANGRVTARADVRFDELLGRLGLELDEEPSTMTLAEMIVNHLQRVPRVGDSMETPIGLMRVDNMARRRITRVSLKVNKGLREIDPGS